MGISINSKMSGFRIWAEIHEPRKIDKAPTGADEGGVIAVANGDQGATTADQQPHRPWLVPGVGRL
ncbi:MAG TPA: hypothetical protein VMU69_10975 [Bradyrhizobium sp.]|nr:hypothetical protein [Bradyrhizobium sp.]